MRELENIVERAVVLTRGDYVSREDLPSLAEKKDIGLDGDMKDVIGSVERRMITDALAKVGWVQTKAAELIGISERMLRYKLKKYGIKKGEE